MTHPDSTSLALRAKVRSSALLEPYAVSFAHAASTPMTAQIVDVPSDGQSLLEGVIVSHLRNLHDPSRDHRGRSRFVITGITATKNNLVLDARGSAVAEVLHGLLPTWAHGQRSIESGIPGLRYAASDSGDGIRFHLLGQPGAVTVSGISVPAFEAYRQNTLIACGLRSVRSDSPRRDPEKRSPLWHIEKWPAASLVARRLGALMHPHVVSIDSWWNSRNSFAVELIASTDKPNPMPAIMSHFLSAHLSPRLHLRRSDGYHHYLSIDGSEIEIDIRMLRRDPRLISR